MARQLQKKYSPDKVSVSKFVFVWNTFHLTHMHAHSGDGAAFKDFDLAFSVVEPNGALRYCKHGVTPLVLGMGTESEITKALMGVITEAGLLGPDTLEKIAKLVPVLVLGDGARYGPIFRQAAVPLNPRKLCAFYFVMSMAGNPTFQTIDSGLRIVFRSPPEESEQVDFGFELMENSTGARCVIATGVTQQLCDLDTRDVLSHLRKACESREAAIYTWNMLSAHASPRLVLKGAEGYHRFSRPVGSRLIWRKLLKMTTPLSEYRKRERKVGETKALQSRLQVLFVAEGDPVQFTDRPLAPFDYGFTVIDCDTHDRHYQHVGLDERALSIGDEQSLGLHLLSMVEYPRDWMDGSRGVTVAIFSHEHRKQEVLKRPSVPLKFWKLGRHMFGSARTEIICEEGGGYYTQESYDSGVCVMVGSKWEDPILRGTERLCPCVDKDGGDEGGGGAEGAATPSVPADTDTPA